MLKPTLKHFTILLAGVVLITIMVTALLLILPRKTFPPPKPVIKPHLAYRINIDSLEIAYGKIGENQNLSSLLSTYISGAMIDRIARETNHVFDVRKFRSGHHYARIMSKAHKTCYFIYEINEIDFVVYDFRDSLRVYTDKKRVTRLSRTAEGTIKSSLWNCIVENRLDINLGLSLSEVYAWTVDFYGLQKGDGFKVIYDELFVDNSPVGIDRIQGAIFRSSGRDYYAVYFNQPGNEGYYDLTGQSLRRSFLKAPLKFSRISSRFTASRMHPILRIARPHFGVDYAAPTGTPVVALGDGRVTEVGWHGGYGRYISIRHNSVYLTTYAHLSGYAGGIRAGTAVKQGELIGYVGSSGLATGPHLDFRVYKNGTPIDPLHMESPTADPITKANLEKFKKIAIPLKAILDSIR